MIPKFRAYNGSTNRMYKPKEVMVCNENIYIDDEDFDSWIQNNDLSLMQSTGLFDKNGVEIFEGDVVKHTESEMTAIIRMHPILGMGIEAEGEVAWADIDLEELADLKKECEKYYEVIGNIYENPELVEHA